MKEKYTTNSFSDVDFWIAEWLKSNLRESHNTHIAYRWDIKNFFEICRKPFNEVTITDLIDYQSHIVNDGYSRKTIARRIASVRSFYRFLNRREVTDIHLDKLEPANVRKSLDKRNFLSEKEIAALIEAAKPSQGDYIFIRFLYLTAVRVSEAITLKWRDISQIDNGAEAQILGKGSHYRTVFIPHSLWSDLVMIRGAESDYLFPTFTPHKAWRMIKRLAKAAGIDKPVSPHSFRHAHISHALKHGATLAELRDQAGHANITTTSLYLHADSERATATRLKIQ